MDISETNKSIKKEALNGQVQRKVTTLVTYSLDEVTIQHAQKNGKHIFIKNNKIAKVGKLKDGIIIELVDGRQYQFLMDRNIKNKWKSLGFNPQFPLDIFYNLLAGVYVKNYKPNTTQMMLMN